MGHLFVQISSYIYIYIVIVPAAGACSSASLPTLFRLPTDLFRAAPIQVRLRELYRAGRGAASHPDHQQHAVRPLHVDRHWENLFGGLGVGLGVGRSWGHGGWGKEGTIFITGYSASQIRGFDLTA